MSTAPALPGPPAVRWALLVRPLLGLLQGMVLYRLLRMDVLAALQPADPYVIAIGILCAVLVPPAICLAIPVLTPLRAVAWALLLSAVLAGLAAYHVWLQPVPRLLPPAMIAWGLLSVCFEAVFIAQGLLLAGVRDGRPRARYTTYFDVAWSQAAQVGLGVMFAGLLWGVLALGAGLFAMIGIDALWHVARSRWFYLPVLTTGFALSVNLTELRVQLLRASRSLFLTLAAWLSPPLTLLTAAFLAALPVTGLQPLWHTHRAGSYLIGAAFVHVLLINAVFGDGSAETAPSRLLRWSAGAACVLLSPLVAIAAYGAILRVEEYGFTPARIFLFADVLVIGTYAAGYAVSLLASPSWLGGLRPTNIAAAWLIVALILLLWSPVADPVRLAVDDQVARLDSGRTPAARFDYAFLQRAGRTGQAALRRLRTDDAGPDAAQVRAMAAAASAGPVVPGVAPPPSRAELAAQIIVHPDGAHLPDSVLQQDWHNVDFRLPACLELRGHGCDAVLLDVMGQGRPQVLFLAPTQFMPAVLLAQDTAQAPWHVVATVQVACEDVAAALRAGRFTTRMPQVQDLVVAGQVVRFTVVPPVSCR